MSTQITLDELANLCDEISALARAGIPLETSLPVDQKRFNGDRLRQMADRLNAGESLAEVLRQDRSFPPLCSAMIEAGQESGHLSASLDIVASVARQLRDAHLFLLRATLYPMFLLTLLWFILVGVAIFLCPIYRTFFLAIERETPMLQLMEWIINYASWLFYPLIALPVIAWLFFGFWAWRGGRHLYLNQSATCFPIRFFHPFFKAKKEMRKAVFVKILALLLEASVPWNRAIELASQIGCGSEKEYSRLLHWAQRIQGESLIHGLRVAGENAMIRARIALTQSEFFLSAIAVVFVGILLCFSYCFIIEWPYIQLFYELSAPF